MPKILDVLRMVVVSFEAVYSVVLSVALWLFPDVFRRLGIAVSQDGEIVKWIPVVPLAACGVAFALAWRLTTPLNGSNRVLFDWPDYWRLKYRRNLSLVLSWLAAGIAICLWIFARSLTALMLGWLFALALGLSLIVVGCLCFATFTLREIVEE